MTGRGTDAGAATFTALHRADRPFVLPNAWDIPSALILQRAGYPAVATTSAGLAAAHGYRDGEHLPFDVLLAVVARMTACLTVPLSVDLEAGYGDSVEAVVARVQAVTDAGAVGINIEDSRKDGSGALRAIEEQATIISAIRKTMGTAAPFINARTDTIWRRTGSDRGMRSETLRRLEAYAEAGAHGVFVPGLTEPDAITEVTSHISLPLNVLASPRLPALSRLADLGVARVSVGSVMFRFCYGRLGNWAGDHSLPDRLGEHAHETMAYDELQHLLPDPHAARHR